MYKNRVFLKSENVDLVYFFTQGLIYSEGQLYVLVKVTQDALLH